MYINNSYKSKKVKRGYKTHVIRKEKLMQWGRDTVERNTKKTSFIVSHDLKILL